MTKLWSKENKDLIFSLISSKRFSTAAIFLFYINSYFTIMRLQNFPGMKIFGVARVPGILTAIVCIVFISYAFELFNHRVRVLKIILFFLLIEGIRGIIGFLVVQDLVVNDALQFYNWRDLLIYLLSLVIPIIYFSSQMMELRTFIKFLLINSFFLGLWSITHSGRGPGGYLGDENDNCLYLLTLLPITCFYIKTSENFLPKFIGSICLLLVSGGIIATSSRGGFLGFVSVVTCLFFLSDNKPKWIISFILGILLIIPFVPQEYYREIRSIKTDTEIKSGGTINERLVTWGIIYRMWKDPRNTIQGVGLANSKFNMSPYERIGTGGIEKSLSGRVAHSFYFQILGDLGLWGISIYGSIIIISIQHLRIISKEARQFFDRSQLLLTNHANKQTNRETTQELNLLALISNEFSYIEKLSKMLLCSWVGLLISGLGISVSYYPTFWMLVAVSTGIWIYFEKLKLSINLINPNDA